MLVTSVNVSLLNNKNYIQFMIYQWRESVVKLIKLTAPMAISLSK